MRALLVFLIAGLGLAAADLRVGIVGTDTSHVTAFTAMLNDAANPGHIPGARVVAAWKGGSPDIPESRDRVERFAAELQSKYGVEMVPDIAAMLPKVDAILLESVDGRTHLAQFRQIAAAGKPVFIDKPLASTFADVLEIARLAKANNVRWFSSSSLRFGEQLAALRIPGLTGAITWGPGPLEEHHQLELSWYGIHTIEMLYTLLGPGCQEVARVSTPGADVVTGRWKDGRIGIMRINRPRTAYGATVFAPPQVAASQGDLSSGYKELVRQIVAFFQGGPPPVPNSETLEIYGFMDAAQRSKEDGGRPAAMPRF